MISKAAILSTAERLDSWLPRLPLAPGRERLVSLLVHSLYQQQHEAEEAGVYPHEHMTVEKFRRFVERFLELGYRFVSPEDVLAPNGVSGKSVLLTFDDGYFNFVRALPVLNEYQIPATLFVCPGYLVNPESFWWDAFYRHAQSSGCGQREVLRTMSRLRTNTADEIRAYIVDRWGKKALRVASDLDRPLTLAEFRDIERDPLVHVGNHTFDHSALPFQSPDNMRSQIKRAEDFFQKELGRIPKTISYPNGDYGNAVLDACEQLGYELGMTIEACSNAFGATNVGHSRLALGRYMLSGERDVHRQVHSIDRSFSIAGSIRRMKKHKYN